MLYPLSYEGSGPIEASGRLAPAAWRIAIR